MNMHTPRINGAGWKKRLADNAARKESQNDPEILARRQEVQARQEAERALQVRLAAEADARRAAEMVEFSPMPVKLAAELIMAFERYRSAGREATAAEIEAVSLMAKGLPLHPGSPQVRVTHGLPVPVSVTGRVDATAEAVTVPKAVAPSKGKREPEPRMDGEFLIED